MKSGVKSAVKSEAETKDEPPEIGGPNSAEAQFLGDPASLADVAVWIAQAAAAGVIGNGVHAAVVSWKRRFGRDPTVELRDEVIRLVKEIKRKPHVAHADIVRRVRELFDEHLGPRNE